MASAADLLGFALVSVKTDLAFPRHGLACFPRALNRLGAVLAVDIVVTPANRV